MFVKYILNWNLLFGENVICREKIIRENLSKAMANIVAKENIYEKSQVNKNIILNGAISESKYPIVINCNCNNNNQFSFCACNEKVPCNLKERVSRFLSKQKQLFIRIGLIAIFFISWLWFYFTNYHYLILQNKTRAKKSAYDQNKSTDFRRLSEVTRLSEVRLLSKYLPVCLRKYPDFLMIHEKVEVNVCRKIYTDFSIIHETNAWKYPSFLNVKIIMVFDIIYTLCIKIPNKLYFIMKVIIVFKIISRPCKKIFNNKLYSFFSFFTYCQIIFLFFIHSIFIAEFFSFWVWENVAL